MRRILLVALLLVGAGAAKANARRTHPFGLGLLVAEGPFFMGQLGLNLGDAFRASAGYGQKTQQVGIVTKADVKVKIFVVGGALFVPGWQFSPFAGADYTSGEASVTVASTKFTAKATGISPKVGLDYTTSSGFNLGVVYYFGELDGPGAYAALYF